ncbi:hypothetical protein TrST_g7948 [Triparma strigata]|uniref:Uncharacterized protein n=1 Tax=Triparma strigata TaxID=1606541 RepID=A0A9W7BTP5_9STRA|nr:hypothetical protein TrST_g7948 [Triparma strigata]
MGRPTASAMSSGAEEETRGGSSTGISLGAVQTDQAFGDPNPEEDTCADHVFDYIYNSENAPLRVGMRFVPPATCSYLAAVCCKVVDSTNGSILGMAAAGAPVVVFVAVAVPMSSYASKMLSVVTI